MWEMQETQVQSWSWEDHLEKEMAPHFSILAWKIPWMEEPGRLQSVVSQKLDTTEHAGMYVAIQRENSLKTRSLGESNWQ